LQHRAFALRAAMAAAVLGAASSGALAQIVAGWERETTASGIELAFFSRPDAELAVRCKGSAVEVFYYLREAALDPVLRGRNNAVLVFAIDDSADLLWRATAMFREPGVVSIGIGDRGADELARELVQAQRNIAVSILTAPPQLNSVHYNTNHFPIHGAADAIKSAYAGCGIRY
jgi:hypothetical protein